MELDWHVVGSRGLVWLWFYFLCSIDHQQEKVSPEDKHHQRKVLKAFNILQLIAEENKSNFSVFPQGFSINIVTKYTSSSSLV